MARGRPKRDKEAERARAEEVLARWRHMPRLDLTVRRAAERYWLRLRLGESEETVDVLDGVVESGAPPLPDTLT